MIARDRVILLTVGAVSVMLASSSDALAIPAFARKYRSTCQTCHTTFPKLNSFGKAFRANGYRFPENDEEQVQESPVSLAKTLWPSSIPLSAPIALRATMAYNASPDSDFLYPLNVSLFAAGTLGDDVSFFAEELIDSAGFGAVLLRAFVQWDHIGGTRLLNARLGQFEIAANPFSSHRQFTFADPYFTSSGTQGLVSLDGNQRGLELYGATSGRKGGLTWSLGVVNGNGSPGLGQGREGFTFDDNKAKDLYAHVSYKIGGVGVATASGTTDRWWRDDSFTLGAMYYRGTASIVRGEIKDDSGLRTLRSGAWFDWYLKDMQLFGGYTKAESEDSIGGANVGENSAWFGEMNYYFLSWLVAGVRYEALTDKVTDAETKRIVPAVTFAVKPNLKVHVEGEIYKADFQPKPDDRYTLFVDFAF